MLKDTVLSILRPDLYDINVLPGKTGGAGAFFLVTQVGDPSFE